jgi:hypothetical protein
LAVRVVVVVLTKRDMSNDPARAKAAREPLAQKGGRVNEISAKGVPDSRTSTGGEETAKTNAVGYFSGTTGTQSRRPEAMQSPTSR